MAKRPTEQSISVVDIFAGPGGLSEGFSTFKTADAHQPFKVRLSIEADAVAHQMLLLRSFYRQFSSNTVPEGYYECLRNAGEPLETRLKALFDAHPTEAERAANEARRATLGKESTEVIRGWIDESLTDSQFWVLIGGPPCQAYSLAGGSRNRGGEFIVCSPTIEYGKGWFLDDR